jgi:hypothetical protein
MAPGDEREPAARDPVAAQQRETDDAITQCTNGSIVSWSGSLQARERVLGPDHPDTIKSRSLLAAARAAVGTDLHGG